jgi:hypothetical protein
MSTIHVHCSHEGKVIGRGLSRYVKRDHIRSAFWRDMEGPCQELSKVAFQLFNRYGRLKKEFKNHPIRMGTGVWGSELDLGSFFVIEDSASRSGVASQGSREKNCIVARRKGSQWAQRARLLPSHTWLSYKGRQIRD